MSGVMIDDLQRRENEAWRKVIARETGQRYLSESQIRSDTRVPPRRIRDMVARCRAMRRALARDAELPGDWWTARLMPLPAENPDTTATTDNSRV